MAGFEMDPMFCKALKLLHSNAKDSGDQILHLLEELVDQKYGGTKSLNVKHANLLFEEPTKPDATKARLSRGPSPVSGLNQPSEKSSRDSSPPSEPVSSRTSPDLDDGDLALEIFEDDLNCTVCKGMSVGARNRLVECSECHLLYHQECHQPPISESAVNDPRLIWYCCECTKRSQEKMQTKGKGQEGGKKGGGEGGGEKKTEGGKKGEKGTGWGHGKASHSGATAQGGKPSAVSSTSSGKHPGPSSSKGSAGLSYKTPGSPTSKGQSTAAPGSIIAADRRLQNMKKKALAKMQEKRGRAK